MRLDIYWSHEYTPFKVVSLLITAYVSIFNFSRSFLRILFLHREPLNFCPYSVYSCSSFLRMSVSFCLLFTSASKFNVRFFSILRYYQFTRLMCFLLRIFFFQMPFASRLYFHVFLSAFCVAFFCMAFQSKNIFLSSFSKFSHYCLILSFISVFSFFLNIFHISVIFSSFSQVFFLIFNPERILHCLRFFSFIFSHFCLIAPFRCINTS